MFEVKKVKFILICLVELWLYNYGYSLYFFLFPNKKKTGRKCLTG